MASGRERRLIPSSAQPLTVALVASGQRGIERGRLLSLLWPDEPAGRCRRRLNTAVWRLRDLSAPNAEAIMSTSTWLGLDQSRVAVDVADLLSVAARRPDEVRSLSTAMMLRAGETRIDEFASGCQHPYVAELRDQLRMAQQRVYVEIAERAALDDEFEVSLYWARRALKEDPYSEHLHRIAIRSLHRLGRVAEAERQFADCRDLLRSDLGVEPEPATLAAAGQVRPSLVPVSNIDNVAELRSMLEQAVAACESAAVAGRELLAALRPNAVRDPAVIGRDRGEIGPI